MFNWYCLSFIELCLNKFYIGKVNLSACLCTQITKVCMWLEWMFYKYCRIYLHVFLFRTDLLIQSWCKSWNTKATASTITRRYEFILTYLLGFPMSDVHTLVKKQGSPLENSQSDSIHRSLTPGSEKKTKETQIRADMESELTTLTDSATTNAQRSRINILEEMSVQEGALAKPHQGSRHEKTHMTYAQYLSPCLVNLIIFLPKQLPENGSLHHHFSWKRQVSSIYRHHASQLCGAAMESECTLLTDINSSKAIWYSTQLILKSFSASLHSKVTQVL